MVVVWLGPVDMAEKPKVAESGRWSFHLRTLALVTLVQWERSETTILYSCTI